MDTTNVNDPKLAEPTKEMSAKVNEGFPVPTNSLVNRQLDFTVEIPSSVVKGNILCKQNGDSTHWLIGGQGGVYNEDARYMQEAYVTRIEAWAGPWQIRGIRILFSDGTVVLRGKAEGRYFGQFEFDYASGEVITELSVWGNGAGTRCGSFRFKTSKGRTYHAAMTDWKLKKEFKMNVGGGIMLGMISRSGADVDALGFLMLDKIEASYVKEVKYIFPERGTFEKKFAYDIVIPNPSDKMVDKGVVKQTVISEKGGEWFVKSGLKVGAEFKVKVEVPKVGVEAAVRWELSVEGGYTNRWKEVSQVSIEIPLVVPEYTKTRIEYAYFQGVLSGCPFTGTMRYDLVNGGEWNLKIKGFYDGLDTTRIVGNSTLLAKWDTKTNKWIDV